MKKFCIPDYTPFLKKKNEILYKYQFGFRENHSTSLALIEIIENVHQYLDNKEIVIGVYIDLTKAFDTVQHDILLHKLQHYGISSTATFQIPLQMV